jgi:hypothetical protein
MSQCVLQMPTDVEGGAPIEGPVNSAAHRVHADV